MLMIIDEHAREWQSIDTVMKLASEDVLERLSDLFVRGGILNYSKRCTNYTVSALAMSSLC